MIYTYGASLAGTYHIKNDIVCQDAHRCIRIGKNIAIAAVADGLGSAAHSDEGSRIAVDTAVEFVREKITPKTGGDDVLDILRASFAAAYTAVEKEAAEQERSPDLYDTTLTLAVLMGETLYYGHSGDSGMLALTAQGRYEAVTAQQRDAEGRVFPLFFTDRWEFARYEHKVAAVLLATDGILETFFPLYIRDADVKIHVSLARFFLDNRNVRIHRVGTQAVQERVTAFMESIPHEQVNDDKTVAVLINASVKAKKQPAAYYEEPDWAELKRQHDEAWKREAYPGLFAQEE